MKTLRVHKLLRDRGLQEVPVAEGAKVVGFSIYTVSLLIAEDVFGVSFDDAPYHAKREYKKLLVEFLDEGDPIRDNHEYVGEYRSGNVAKYIFIVHR